MKFVTVLVIIIQILFLSCLVVGLYLLFMRAFNMKLYCMCADSLGRFRSSACGDQYEILGNRNMNQFDLIMYSAALAWGILIEWVNWKVGYVSDFLTGICTHVFWR